MLRKSRGFTLVEMLVAISILALTATVIALNAPQRRTAEQDEAEQLAARIQIAIEHATLTGKPIRLDINEEGYSFVQFKEGKWENLRTQYLKGGRFVSSVRFDVEDADPSFANERYLSSTYVKVENEEKNYQILIDPVGQSTPFTASFGAATQFDVSLDPAGKIRVKRK